MTTDPRLRIAAMLLVVVIAVVAAYGIWSSSSAADGGANRTAAPSAGVSHGSEAPSPDHPAPDGSPAGPSGPHAVVDRSLLAVLPPSIGGNALSEDPDAEKSAVADPDLGANVDRIVTAFVGDPSGQNWAYTAVVDVRPVARTNDFYKDWQATFDQSACDQAGGVTGHATLQIAGRAVNQSTCGGGVRTYHVRMNGGGLMVSISDLGPSKYGEQVLQALQP